MSGPTTQALLERLSSPEIEALRERGDWTGVDLAFAAVFGEAEGAASRWALLNHDLVASLTATLDGELSPPALEAVVTALFETDGDRAHNLAIASSLATMTVEGALSRLEPIFEVKRGTHALLRARLGGVAELLAPNHDGALRAAAAMLLARFPAAASEHLEALGELAGETTWEVAGAGLLALALIARYGGVDPGAAARGMLEPRASRALAGADEPLVVAAACALALASREVPEAARPRFVAGIEVATSMPISWGFLLPDALRGDPLWCLVEETLVTLDSLDPWLDRMVGRISGYTLERAVLPFAFGRCADLPGEHWRVDFEGVPPGGLVLEELSPTQRVVLERAAQVELPWQLRWPLGFHLPEDITRFLAAEDPAHVPLEVRLPDGSTARWHALAIWRRRVLGAALTEAAAAAALVQGLRYDAVLEVVLGHRDRLPLWNQGMDAEAKLRDRGLMVAILAELERRGSDPRPKLRAFAARAELTGPVSLPLLAEALGAVFADEWPEPDKRELLERQHAHYYGEG